MTPTSGRWTFANEVEGDVDICSINSSSGGGGGGPVGRGRVQIQVWRQGRILFLLPRYVNCVMYLHAIWR